MKKNKPIRGLLLYTFYTSATGLKLTSALSLLFGIIIITAGKVLEDGKWHNMPPFFAMIGIGFFSCSFLICEYKDSVSKWDRYQLAMPIKRSDVIASKYLGHLLMLIWGIVFTGIFLCVTIAVQVFCWDCFKNIAIFVFPGSIGASLITCALFYPAAYTLGIDKDGALVLGCMLGASGINALILWTGNATNLPQNINAVVCVAISAVLFVVSYMVTKRIYAKKDL